MASEKVFDEQAAAREAEKVLNGERLEHPVRLLITGRSGSGKSSLINALVRKELRKTGTGKPVTQDIREIEWDDPAAKFVLIDVPGFGEADKHESRVNTMLDMVASCHALVLVAAAPDRAWDYEVDFIKTIHQAFPKFPVFIVGNKIDLLPPSRDWAPNELNLDSPSTKKERNIVEWSNGLKDAFQRSGHSDSRHFNFICAGEYFGDHESEYGLSKLREDIVSALPETLRASAALALDVDLRDKRPLAEKIIWGSSILAGTAALNPIPMADAFIQAPIQVGMIISIAKIYRCILTFKSAAALLAPAAATFLGRVIYMQLAKLIPVAGSIVGAGVAATITMSIGYTYLELFARGDFQPTEEEVKKLLRQNFEEARKHKDELEKEIRNRNNK